MDVSKRFCNGEHKFFCWNEGAMSGVFYKNIFIADLLGSLHLFEIIQTSLTVKNSENVMESWCFEKLLQWRAPNIFQN